MIKKILFVLLQFMSVATFIILLCSSPMHQTEIIGAFVGCMICIYLTFVLLYARELGSILLPLLVCVFAGIHAIFRPISNICRQCYETKQDAGSYRKCFRKCRRKYNEDR